MRAVFSILAILIVVCATQVDAQTVKPRPGLCISTNSSSALPLQCDAAVNGVVTGAWMTPMVQFLNVMQPVLYISLDPNAPNVGALTQQVTLVYNYPTGAVAYWSLGNETAVATAASNISVPINTNGTLVCEVSGFTNFSITVNVAGYQSIELLFTKRCSYPNVEIGTYEGDSNVMHMTKPVATFANYMYSADVKDVGFIVYLNQNQIDPTLIEQPFTLAISSMQPDALAIAPAGIFGWKGTAFTGGMESYIHAAFACSNKTLGALDVGVYGVLDFGWSTPVVFKFKYRCGVGEAVPGLTLSNSFATIATNGRVVPPFNGTYAYNPDGMGQGGYAFPLFVNSSQIQNLAYNVSMFTESADVFVFNITSQTGGVMVDGTLVFLADIVCQNQGTARGLIQFEFGTYIPVQLQIKFPCVFPPINVGDEPLSNNVVAMGATTGWVGNADANKMTSDFFIELDTSSKVYYNMFTIVPSSYNAMYMEPTISGGTGNATINPNSDENHVQLEFNCIQCTEIYQSPVQLTLYYGWAQTAQINLVKDCVIPDNELEFCGISRTPNHGGWTAGAIAALVISMLVLAACVSGCLWNRLKEEKRGLAIIPGYEAAAGCCDSVGSKGRTDHWSPQEDTGYQSSFASASRGHSNYSTNL